MPGVWLLMWLCPWLFLQIFTSDCILVEISAMNGRFTLDFTQAFSSPVYMNAFLKELDENGITYDLQDVNPLELLNIKLPWSE